MQVNVSEEAINKIKEIEEDVRVHIERHHVMTPSHAVTKKGLELVKEARKAGIIPKVIFKGKEVPVNINYGGYRYG